MDWNEFVAQQNAQMNNCIENLRGQAEQHKKFLLSDDILKERDWFYDMNLQCTFGYLVYKIYSALIFFPEDIIYKGFEKIGLTKENLIWQTDITKIKEEILKINSIGSIYILPTATIFFVEQYLESKIKTDFLSEFQLVFKYNGANSNLVDKYFKNYCRRKGKLRSQSLSYPDAILDKLFLDMETRWPDQMNLTFKDYFTKELTGNTERIYLSEIFKSAIEIGPSISKNSKFRLFFDLFRLIIKDKQLAGESDFYNIASLYKNNYQFYQTSRIKKILE